ncbi:hypothetical protein GCM10027423_19740 [Spirosoma arcticum]
MELDEPVRFTLNFYTLALTHYSISNVKTVLPICSRFGMVAIVPGPCVCSFRRLTSIIVQAIMVIYFCSVTAADSTPISMVVNSVKQIQEFDQSIWLDFIDRKLLDTIATQWAKDLA